MQAVRKGNQSFLFLDPLRNPYITHRYLVNLLVTVYEATTMPEAYHDKKKVILSRPWFTFTHTKTITGRIVVSVPGGRITYTCTLLISPCVSSKGIV